MPEDKKKPDEEMVEMAREIFKSPQELLAESTVYTYDVDDTFGQIGVDTVVGASTALWIEPLKTPLEPGAEQAFFHIRSEIDLSVD